MRLSSSSGRPGRALTTPNTVSAMRAFSALIYLSQSRVADAVPLMEEVFGGSKRPGSAPTTPRRSRICRTWPWPIGGAGRLKEALPMLEKALAAMKARPNPDQRGLLLSMTNLGVMYREAGRRDEARLFREVVGMMKSRRGPDHPDTLYAMHNLAVTCYQAGRLDEAIPLFEEVVKLRKKKLLPDHPDTLASTDGLVEAYLVCAAVGRGRGRGPRGPRGPDSQVARRLVAVPHHEPARCRPWPGRRSTPSPSRN